MTFEFCFQAYLKLGEFLPQDTYTILVNHFRKIMVLAAKEQKAIYPLESRKAKTILSIINKMEEKSTSPLRYGPRKSLLDMTPSEVIILPENKFVWLKSKATIDSYNEYYWPLLLLCTLNFNTVSIFKFLEEEFENSEIKTSFLKNLDLTTRDAHVSQSISKGMIETINEWIISKKSSTTSNLKRIRPGKSTRVKKGWLKGVFIFMEILDSTESSSFCYDCDQNELAEALSILSRAGFDTLEQDYPKVRRRNSKYKFDAATFTQVRNMLSAFQHRLDELESDYKTGKPGKSKKS